ncbi:hypothetical protein EDB85DRAFT_547978 [Lactarius pseudohatsudake]|nr:hypothetical protein EDB85DRAFT_547978 [Lactarius pseudohatsudake]
MMLGIKFSTTFSLSVLDVVATYSHSHDVRVHHRFSRAFKFLIPSIHTHFFLSLITNVSRQGASSAINNNNRLLSSRQTAPRALVDQLRILASHSCHFARSPSPSPTRHAVMDTDTDLAKGFWLPPPPRTLWISFCGSHPHIQWLLAIFTTTLLPQPLLPLSHMITLHRSCLPRPYLPHFMSSKASRMCHRLTTPTPLIRQPPNAPAFPSPYQIQPPPVRYETL